MNNIEINVSSVSGQILGKLDLGDAEINTIFSLVDVREPDKRSANYTTTFTIPGTKINHGIFSHIQTEGFHVWSFDPNFKLVAQILVNGNQYFNGYLQLNDLTKDDSDNIVGYNITIYEKFVDFYKNISYKLDKIIDISEYDHNYTIPNVVGSWDNFIIKNGQKSAFNLGDGYVYPYDWRGQSNFNQYSLNDFNPAIYLKTLVDKVFKSGGITYQSSFFNSDYFKKLILPYTGDRSMDLSKEIIDLSSTRVGMVNQPSDPLKPSGTAFDIYLFSFESYSNRNYQFSNINFTNENDTLNKYYDTNNNYSLRQMKVPKNGKYIFNIRLPLRILFTAKEPDGTPWADIKTVGGEYETTVYLRRNGSIVGSWKYTMTDPKYNKKSTAYTTDVVMVSEEWTGYCKVGDIFTVTLDLRATESNYTSKTLVQNLFGIFVQKITIVRLCLTNISSSFVGDDRPFFSMALVDEIIEEGDKISMNSFIPDINASDLIKDINKMFNLYWMPIGKDKFLIEPRNNFYIGGSIKDWTYNVDEESEIKIEPLYELTANEYTFTYSEDDDFYNADYISNYEEVYSTKNIKVENDFVDDLLEIKTLFSSSPIVRYGSTNRKGAAYIDSDNKYKRPKLRLLFYGGLLNTTSWRVRATISGLVHNTTKYPYAGHLDNPDSPANDLSWAIPQKYYYNWNSLVNSNLFNLFWRAQIEEITDKNGHLLTGTFILDDVDMIRFDIRDVIQFRNVYYRVNKITHNPLLGVAEVELLKLKSYTAFKSSTISNDVASGTGNVSGTTWGWGYTKAIATNIASGSTGIVAPIEWRIPQVWNSINPAFEPAYYTYNSGSEIVGINPIAAKIGQDFGDIIPRKSYYPTIVNDKNENFYSTQAAVKVLGQGNNIDASAQNVSITGDGNKVGSLVKNINVSGNGNLIESGVQNVTVVGDNQHVRKSNVSYINGNIIDNAGVRKNITILKGGQDAVGGSELVCGGKNRVYANMIYSGGQDRV